VSKERAVWRRAALAALILIGVVGYLNYRQTIWVSMVPLVEISKGRVMRNAATFIRNTIEKYDFAISPHDLISNCSEGLASLGLRGEIRVNSQIGLVGRKFDSTYLAPWFASASNLLVTDVLLCKPVIVLFRSVDFCKNIQQVDLCCGFMPGISVIGRDNEREASSYWHRVLVFFTNHRSTNYSHPSTLFNSHFLQLAPHDSELFVRRIGLSARIDRQRVRQTGNCDGGGSGNNAIVPIKAVYKIPDGTIKKLLSIIYSALIIAFGYFSLAWGGGALLLWRNPLGLLTGGIAIILGIACVGHGLYNLVH
jgi:hypothetical protein